MVCLSSSPSNQKIIHTAAKLASTLHAEFTALYVQTPALVNMGEEDQKRLQTHMKIERQCGAEIITTHGDDISIQIAEYARLSHVTQIVIGRSGVQRRYFWTKPTLTERLIELLPNLDIYIIPDGNVYAAYQEKKCAGAMTESFSDSEYLYFLIFTGQHVYGVLAIYVEEKRLDAFENSIVRSILGECALALDNIRNAREKEQAAVLAKNEQLRANLLRAISHDLRTPLTAISGNADVLLNSLDSLDAETSRQMLSDIYDDSKWLTELVENLLAITKIGDGTDRRAIYGAKDFDSCGGGRPFRPKPHHDYRYIAAVDGASAITQAASHNPDIVLLDLGLPDMDGVEIIEKIRTWSNMPIIVISARSEDSDKIGALDAGADDYLTKPFSVEELLARLRVTQRRLALLQTDGGRQSSIFVNGALKIDYAAGCAYLNDSELHLTPIEYKLLCLLAQNAGKVLTYSFITQKIWGSSWDNDVASLRVFMATLRKKIEKGADSAQYIQTHIGVGYRMLRVESLS